MQLESKKYRDKYGLYLIEGDNLIDEAIKRGAELKSIFIREDYCGRRDLTHEELYVLKGKLFANVAQTETSQGVVAVVKKTEYSENEFFNLCGEGNLVVFDRLQDPGNIGTIIRTAEAAGYKGAIFIKGTGDVFSPKAVRAAAGSLFKMPVLFMETPEGAVKAINNGGKTIAAACRDADVRYYDVDLSKNIALIIGNEGGGICEEFLAAASLKVMIPMEDGVDSLNAAVAAGILMYERKRKD